MKIEIKKTVETTEMVEVEFPLYRKDVKTVGTSYYILISENKYIEVYDWMYMKAIKNCNLHVTSEYYYEESNQSEFLEAYNRVQNELTIEFHNQFSSEII